MIPYCLMDRAPSKVRNYQPSDWKNVFHFFVYFGLVKGVKLGGGFKYVFFHPYLGKIPILTNIFQMG